MAVYQVNMWGGSLSRKAIGFMNSALARWGKSVSLNPWHVPNVLVFNELATNLDPTHATVTDLIVSMAGNVESGVLYQYAIDRSGHVYKINTQTDAITLISSTLGITLKFGGGIKVVNSSGGGTPITYLVISHDAGALTCLTDGSSSTAIALLSSATWTANIPHPISDEFAGYIYIGNGYNLVQWSIASIVTISNSVLSPTAPQNFIMNSLMVDGEGRYLRITITTNSNQDLETVDPTYLSATPVTRNLYWNGQDPTYDSFDPMNQSNNSASYSFAGNDISFGQDFWGAAMYGDQGAGLTKIFGSSFFRPPLQGAITSSGSLLFFGAPYLVQGKWVAGIFANGVLDGEDNPSTWPLLGIPATTPNTIVTQVGVLALAQNRFNKSDGTQLTNSKFYISVYETSSSSVAQLYSFNLTPGAGTASLGVYETQIEQFLMMQTIKRIGIYMRPSQANVSFKLEVIDIDETVALPTAGSSFVYTFATDTGAGWDNLLGSGEYIELAGDALPQKYMQGMGLRLTNLGTAQPYITQIFIETQDSDKSATPPE